MEKVLMLSASPRREGNTMLLLGECAKVMEAEGVEAEIFSFAGKEIKSCIACGRCGELGRCAQKDPVNEIIAKVREARGFVVGTPVYFGTARGDLMSALQRIGMVSKATGGFLSRKIGGPIAVARRGGQTATVQELLMFYLINDMVVPGSNYWNIVFAREQGEVWQDQEGVEVIRHFAANVAWLVKSL
jgi:multimeric flavodoxin WrbA